MNYGYVAAALVVIFAVTYALRGGAVCGAV